MERGWLGMADDVQGKQPTKKSIRARLRREGRYDAFMAEVERLAGLKGGVQREVWWDAVKKFPPLPPGKVPLGAAVVDDVEDEEDEEAGACDGLPVDTFEGRESDLASEMDWVSRVLELDVKKEHAPSGRAWNLLQWAKGDPNKFWDNFLKASAKRGDEGSDPGVVARKPLQCIDRVLGMKNRALGEAGL